MTNPELYWVNRDDEWLPRAPRSDMQSIMHQIEAWVIGEVAHPQLISDHVGISERPGAFHRPGAGYGAVMTLTLDHGLDQQDVRHWIWDLVAPEQPTSLWDWCIAHPQLPQGRTFDPKKARLMRYWYDVIDARLRRRPMAGHPTAHLATEISLVLAAQLYKSTLLNQVMLYALGPQSRKCALFMPRDRDLKAVRKGKLRPMLDANDDLTRLLPQGELERDKALAADLWQIGTAALYFQQGCVAADYRREDYELICSDERDKFPANVEGEGDPRTLQRQRGRTYPNTFLMVDVTTPTLYEADGWQSFIKGSCQRPIVSLPCCGYTGDLDPDLVVLPEGRQFAEVSDAEITKRHLGRYALPPLRGRTEVMPNCALPCMRRSMPVTGALVSGCAIVPTHRANGRHGCHATRRQTNRPHPATGNPGALRQCALAVVAGYESYQVCRR